MLAGLVVTVATVPFYHSMGVWAVALSGHFMWSRTHLAVALAISRLFSLLTPVVGYLTDRFGPRRLVLPGLCIVAAGFVAFGLMQNLPTYYASSIIIVIGVELSGTIPLIVMLSRWFVRRRAVAIAIYLAIPSLLAVPLVPMIAWTIDTETAWVGWRASAFIVAGAVALVVAVAFFRLRNSPGRQGAAIGRRHRVGESSEADRIYPGSGVAFPPLLVPHRRKWSGNGKHAGRQFRGELEGSGSQ